MDTVVYFLSTMSLGPANEKSSQISGKYEVQEIECSESIDIEVSTSAPPVLMLTPAEEDKLYQKIDLRIMPMLVIMYTCSFLDRGKCSQGMIQYVLADANLKGTLVRPGLLSSALSLNRSYLLI